MQHLDRLLARLIQAEVEFVLVGGLAAAIHGSSLNTRDVDVCCRFTETNLKRIQDAFHDLNPVHRARPDIVLNVTPEFCAGLKNLYLKTDIGIVDCLGEVLGIGEYDAVLAHSIILDLPAGPCRILDVDALIKAKEAMGRPHDLITVQHLRALKARTSR